MFGHNTDRIDRLEQWLFGRRYDWDEAIDNTLESGVLRQVWRLGHKVDGLRTDFDTYRDDESWPDGVDGRLDALENRCSLYERAIALLLGGIEHQAASDQHDARSALETAKAVRKLLAPEAIGAGRKAQGGEGEAGPGGRDA